MTIPPQVDHDLIGLMTANAFREVFQRLKDEGKHCSPRGQLVIEAENFTYELPPYVKFPNFIARKYSELYIRNELLWYLRASKLDKTIFKHAKMWTDLVNLDGSINSNYGQYIFGSIENRNGYTADWPNQFDTVIKTLSSDKDSRRASIVILQPYHLLMTTNDVPCTYSINFRIRDNQLNMSVHMRSQDAMFGMGNDAPAFSMFQEMVYVTLRDTVYPDLLMGSYHHTADSFHVYERHFEMLDKIITGDEFKPLPCPKIFSINEVRHLRGTIHLAYKDGRESITYQYVDEANKQLRKSMHLIPNFTDGLEQYRDQFQFSNWLVEGAKLAEEKEAASKLESFNVSLQAIQANQGTA